MRHSIETNPPKELVTVKLKAVREHRGYSKNRLAAMAGIQPGVIGWIESGRFIPYGPQLARIADALDWPKDRMGELLEPLEIEQPDFLWEV